MPYIFVSFFIFYDIIETRYLRFDNFIVILSRLTIFAYYGTKNSKTHPYLVENFEREYLKKEYPSLALKDAYRQLIIDTMKDGGEEFIRKIPEEGKAHFKQRKLRLELYSLQDSIWVELEPNNTFSLKN